MREVYRFCLSLAALFDFLSWSLCAYTTQVDSRFAVRPLVTRSVSSHIRSSTFIARALVLYHTQYKQNHRDRTD